METKYKVTTDLKGFNAKVSHKSLLEFGKQITFKHKFTLEHNGRKWTGFLTNGGTKVQDSEMKVGKDLANYLGVDDGGWINVRLSDHHPLQLLRLKKDGSGTTCYEITKGTFPQKGDIVSYKKATYKVELAKREGGYFDESTNVECIDEQGELVALPSQVYETVNDDHVDPFKKIIGMDGVVENFKRKIILPLSYPELLGRYSDSPIRGIMIYGPPGVGKTKLVTAMAEELSVPLITLKPNEVVGKLEIISQKYARAKMLGEKSIVFVDEADKIFKKNAFGDQVEAEMLSQMDGVDASDKVVTILCTNEPDDIPDAIKRSGRIDEVVAVGVPVKKDREELFKLFLDDKKIEELNYRELANITPGFTGADIESVAKNVGLAVFSSEYPQPPNDDKLITQFNLCEEIARFESTGARILNLEKPRFNFSNLHCLDTFKQEVETHLYENGLFESAKTHDGLILHGPSGTGKSAAAHAVADLLGVRILTITPGSFLSSEVGKTEEKLRRLFRNARLFRPCVLLFDELDSFGNSKNHFSEMKSNLLSELVSLLDGSGDNKGIVCIGTTNNIGAIDERLLRNGRFGKHISFSLPDKNSKVAIFKGLLAQHQITCKASESLIADKLRNSTQSKIAQVCEQIRKELKGCSSSILTDSLLEAA